MNTFCSWVNGFPFLEYKILNIQIMLSVCSLWSLTHFDCTINYNQIKTMTTLALTHPIESCLGLPWWLSGKESTCQCRRHGFDPWSSKIPYTSEQLSPCATAIELVLESLGAATTEFTCRNYWSLCALEPALCNRGSCRSEKQGQRLESSPCSLKPEGSPRSSEDPALLKINK